MATITTVAGVLVCIGTLTAQSVGVTLSALTPLSVQASVGAVSSANTLPAGPLMMSGVLSTTLPAATIAGAEVQWWVPPPTNQSVYVRLAHTLYNPAALPNFAGRCGPHEFLVEFTSAVPRTTTLTIGRALVLAQGVPAPTLQIDFDNDGVVDVSNPSSTTATTWPMSFGPLPKLVRIVVDATLGAQTGMEDWLALELTPGNGLAIAQPVANCNPVLPSPPPMLRPSFDDRGIDLYAYSFPGELSLLVFGFAPQPTLLSIATLPCILLPTPDVVLFPNGLFHLPLPASVRPVTFYVQGVTLTPSALLSSEGYVVNAN